MSLEDAVLRKIRPKAGTIRRLDEAVEQLRCLTDGSISRSGMDLQTMLVGSVAKGTYVGEPDIDLFVLFPESVERKDLEKIGLRIGKEVLGGETRYAEHPYTHGKIGGFEVDLVPCYALPDASKIRSAVDRTPFHTRFVLSSLDAAKREQVLLLKQFMKGVGVYGAEARVQGFSGYLTELLIIKFGDLLSVLKAASGWRPGIIMDVNTIKKAGGGAPLTFWDPVDAKRNVSSALSLDQFCLFVHASREYLRGPSERFFFPRKRPLLDIDTIEATFRNRGTSPLSVVLERPDLVDDNLYPQVQRSILGLRKLLEMNDFQVLDMKYSVGKDIRMVFEMVSTDLPPSRLHQGPPACTDNADDFISKWRASGIGQPFILDGKWMVYARREHRDPVTLIRAKGKEAALGNDLRELKGQKCFSGQSAYRTENRRAFTLLLDKREGWRV
ncbi:MAG TPA: CCA tRNA nucleotidyltransferase [Methanomassiliicoccales archaeon]|nr:CCA tRNA nucleotidyltransferase [Methanomassiliicoccales archaeon]